MEIRKQIQLYLEQWQWLYNSQSVPLPLNISFPQPELPILSGFQCHRCGFKSINRRVIRQHCNSKHDQKGWKDEKLFQTVQLQTWFGEKWARYWVVDAMRQARDVNTGNESGSGSGSGSGSSDAEAAIKAEIEEWIKKEEGQYKASIIATEVDPWLQYTGWEEVLAGSKHNLVTTAAFTATASATELELLYIIESWKRIVQRSFITLVAVSNYKDILKWWASLKIYEADQKPFERLQNHKITIP